jgi:type IX secretion system PorP/SprF family membrane protein
MFLINPTYNFNLLNKALLKAVLFFVCYTVCIKTYGQQTFSYTQYMNNLTPINPAYSLIDQKGNFDMLARRQWAGVDGAPTTLFFDGNLPLEGVKGSAGLIIENDKFGVENLTEINAFYAQAVQLSDEKFLAVSFTLGFKNYVADYSQLDPNDPALSPDTRENKPNVGFGVMYYSKNFYLGLSVPELAVRNLGEASLLDNNYFRNNYFLTGGFTLEPVDGIKLKPAALVSYTRGVPLITDISGTLVIKDFLGIGINYRTNNDAALIITTDFSSFYVGYSYQFGVSTTSIGGYSNATQEISLGIRFNKKSKDAIIQRNPKIF